jgi:hypothetical protein
MRDDRSRKLAPQPTSSSRIGRFSGKENAMFVLDRRKDGGHAMTNEAMKLRAMLGVLRSQLRSDLSEMAEDVLQQRFGASHDNGDVRDLDVERLRSELALRTMASRYALLSRIDEALEPPGEAACTSPECAVAQSAASHDAVAV